MSDSRHVRLTLMYSASAVKLASNLAAALVATRALGPSDRGTMVLGLSIGSVVGMVGGLGTGSVLRSRLPTEPTSRSRMSLLAAYTWCSIGGAVIAPVTATAIVAGSSSVIDPVLGTAPFLVATATFTLTHTLHTQIVELWYANGRFHRGLIASAAMSLCGFGFTVAVLASTDSPAAVLGAQAGGMLIVALFEIAILRRLGLVVPSVPDRSNVCFLLRRGLPALGLAAGLALAGRADRYLLGAFAGPAAVGIYSLAATISEMSRILPITLGQLFLHDVSLGHGTARLVRVGKRAVIATVVGGILATFGGWLLIVPIFGAEFAPARQLLAVLAVAEVLLAPYLVAGRGILGGGWMGTAGALGIGTSLAALAIYAFAAGIAGSTGTAVGSVLVYGALSATSWTLLRRRLTAESSARSISTTPQGQWP